MTAGAVDSRRRECVENGNSRLARVGDVHFGPVPLGDDFRLSFEFSSLRTLPNTVDGPRHYYSMSPPRAVHMLRTSFVRDVYFQAFVAVNFDKFFLFPPPPRFT